MHFGGELLFAFMVPMCLFGIQKATGCLAFRGRGLAYPKLGKRQKVLLFIKLEMVLVFHFERILGFVILFLTVASQDYSPQMLIQASQFLLIEMSQHLLGILFSGLLKDEEVVEFQNLLYDLSSFPLRTCNDARFQALESSRLF